ncbi:MAG: ABC transporter ATP-binding protein [Anaeromyxobacter sp.]|nr:ABC transporter ATP-binding protein [Anaeromyxobacter sp.]MBL0276742.1 ABC transporter ATP-binding protein [Anaeromyxobacter sp.]
MTTQADAAPPTRRSFEHAPAAIEVEGLTRRFADFTALDSVDVTIREGEFFSLLGPSGCGKTTLLRIIGGLDQADGGVVRIAGQDARTIPAHKRPVNTVFQSYALFPHLTVRQNVAFGLRMKRVAEPERGQRVEKAIEMVQIGAFADRKPGQLSGGQKQRVALARALVNEPKVLLLDEPLGALDLKLRKELQVELLGLQRRLGITFVFVTHDQEEALVMSDRIAVMRAGKIEQLGEVRALYERPRNRFVGQFLGSCNLLEGAVESSSPEELTLASPVGTLRARRRPGDPGAVGTLTLAIRPEKVRLLPDFGKGENRFECIVEQLIYTGNASHYHLRCGQQKIKAEVMNAAAGAVERQVGQRVAVELPADSLVVLED